MSLKVVFRIRVKMVMLVEITPLLGYHLPFKPSKPSLYVKYINVKFVFQLNYVLKI